MRSDSEGEAATTRRRVLVVEDEGDLARIVQRHLESIGCHVRIAATGEDALEAAAGSDFDLVLLDVMLPGIDGLEVCQKLRARQQYMPVLMLTARSSETDKVLGLETGADDYITKPFSLRELLARVRAMFRRLERLDELAGSRSVPIPLGERVVIDPRSHEVRVEGLPVSLTHKEFDLLLHFARNPDRVFTREQLLDAVWGYSHDTYEHAVNCHINRLRAKIERNPARPDLITTVWGVGYKLAPPPR
jgi:DNA-binding response OmpR family regulator